MISNNQQLSTAVIKRRPTYTLKNSASVKFRFSEVVTFMITKPKDLVLIEFDIRDLTNRRDLSTLHVEIIDHLSTDLKCKLWLRQVIYNKVDRLQLYCNLSNTPEPSRKATSGYSTDSTSSINCERKLKKSQSHKQKQSVTNSSATASGERSPPPATVKEDTEPDQPNEWIESYTGELKKNVFNGSIFKVPVIRRSTACQTRSPQLESLDEVTVIPSVAPEVHVQPAVDYSSCLMFRALSHNETYQRARKFLSYYKDNRDIVFQHCSYVSLKNELKNDGLNFDTDDELMKIFLTWNEQRGICSKSVLLDLENLKHAIATQRTIYFDRARQAHQNWSLPTKSSQPRTYDKKCHPMNRDECTMM